MAINSEMQENKWNK